MSLSSQVTEQRKKEIAKVMDPAAGKTEAQRKIDLAGDKKQMLVQAARRIARKLAENGPITIDDVTQEMAKSYNVLPVSGKRQHQWKGSVFTKSEWSYIGDMPSRQVSAHARPIGVWALKSWLAENTLNGKNTSVSSFVLSRMYTDFKKIHPAVALEQAVCYMGEERIAAEIVQAIKHGGDKLYGTPVSWIPGAVGAIIIPPMES